MCCFSIARPVGFFERWFPPKVNVSATNIFARLTAPGVQALAYGMNLDASAEVAMILPLPVARAAGEDALTFLDLSAHPRMFSELAALFEPPAMGGMRGGLSRAMPAPKTLAVHEVGSFIASYVPTRADFTRLDPRFRVPDVLFEAVPHYADYGFAVFQLEAGKSTIHPMAFTFPTREPDKLFLPTVHVHDGTFQREATFDHALYYQAPRDHAGDETAWGKLTKDYSLLVDRGSPMHRRTLQGKLPNQDTWLAA